MHAYSLDMQMKKYTFVHTCRFRDHTFMDIVQIIFCARRCMHTFPLHMHVIHTHSLHMHTYSTHIPHTYRCRTQNVATYRWRRSAGDRPATLSGSWLCNIKTFPSTPIPSLDAWGEFSSPEGSPKGQSQVKSFHVVHLFACKWREMASKPSQHPR